jgi:hypothetical protein
MIIATAQLIHANGAYALFFHLYILEDLTRHASIVVLSFGMRSVCVVKDG